MKSILEQLSSMTVVVADTGDLDSIKKFQPRDATTNPSLILAAAKNPDYVKLIDKALESSENALPEGFSEIELIKETVDQVSVFFGKEILKIISGRVSTEVDARLSFDSEATVEKARKLINLYKNFGIEKERILIKIAATWEGIKAENAFAEVGEIIADRLLNPNDSQIESQCKERVLTLCNRFPLYEGKLEASIK